MRVRITVLGGLGVDVGGNVVAAPAWRSRRAAQLVALLALAPNHRLATEQVMDALWPDLAPEAARANLHKTATLARQAMGSRQSVVLRGDAVALWPEHDLAVDLDQFEAAARAALASGDRDACAQAAQRFGGELLPEERYEEWAVPVRERVRLTYLDLLRTGEMWAELAEAEPTDEPAHRALMRQHFEAGRLHAAIRQFQRLRTILARDVGVLPAPQTVALYREITGTASSGWVRPGLVGREVEMVRARGTLRRAAEGRPGAIFVTGAAGIGKTRLCEELIEQVTGEGWFVLRGSGREQTAAVPYWPLVEAVQAALLERPDASGALGDAERALLSRLTGLATDPPAGAVHRHAVLHLVSRVIAAAGADRTMLFLDDLHHVDEDTCALVGILAGASMPRGVLLLAAFRPDGGDHASFLARTMVARGIGVEIRLGSLSRAESDAIVGDVLNRQATEGELGLAWELSEGNPFFALEIAAALSSDEAAAAAGAYAAVDVRLERLPPQTRQCLRSVAVAADHFTADEFAALAAVNADRALEHLAAAMAEGVVAHQSGMYRFRHDLVRDRLTATVPGADRAGIHAVAAARLAALGAPPARVAHHLLAASRPEEALPWLRRAAQEAIDVGAYTDALGAIERGLEIASRDASLLGLRADAMNGQGDPGAPAAYSVAMAVSPEPERAVFAVRRAKALILAGDVPGAVDTLAVVRDPPPSLLGQLEVARGLAQWCTGGLDEAEESGRRAKRIAEETGSVRDFVDATMVLAMVAHERGAWPQRVSLDLLDRHVRPDLAAVVMDAHLCVAESYLYGGVPYPEVIRFATDLREQAVAARSPRAEAFATTLLGEAHLLMGDTPAAATHLRGAVEQHRRVGVLCGEALSLQRLAQALAAEGRAAEAGAALSSALVAARGSPVGTRHLLDRIHGTAVRWAQAPDEAIAAVDEAAGAIRGPYESCPPCSINFTIPASVACAAGGDLDRAAAYLAASEGIVAAFYPQGGWPAALDEARAHMARATGNAEGADRLLAAAAEAFERLGQRLDADRCRRDLTAAASARAGKV